MDMPPLPGGVLHGHHDGSLSTANADEMGSLVDDSSQHGEEATRHSLDQHQQLEMQPPPPPPTARILPDSHHGNGHEPPDIDAVQVHIPTTTAMMIDPSITAMDPTIHHDHEVHEHGRRDATTNNEADNGDGAAAPTIHPSPSKADNTVNNDISSTTDINAGTTTTGKPKVKYRVYTEENLKLAVKAILEDGMSLRKASSAFGVPKTTIAERVGNRRPPPKQKVVVPTIVTRRRTGDDLDMGGGSATAGAGAGGAAVSAAAGNGSHFGHPSNGNSNSNMVGSAVMTHSTAATVPTTASMMSSTSHPTSILPTPSTRYTWTENEMLQAVEAVQAGGMTVADAARRFGVPASNLNSRARGREPKSLKGDVSRLTLRQESLLAEWAGAQAALGFPASKDDVYDLAERVLQKTTMAGGAGAGAGAGAGGGGGGGVDGKKLGKQWIVHWQRRWPHVEVLDWKENEVKMMRRKRRRDEDGGDINNADADVGMPDVSMTAAPVAEHRPPPLQQQQQQQQQPQEQQPQEQTRRVVQADEQRLSVQDELQQQLEQDVVTAAQPLLYNN